jgi:heme exporter protein CcmD
MAMKTFYAFLHMGGYAFYVWSAYSIVGVSILFMACSYLFSYRKLKYNIAHYSPSTAEKTPSPAVVEQINLPLPPQSIKCILYDENA